MSDPTALILASTLAAALVIFLVGAGLRSVRRHRLSDGGADEWTCGKVSVSHYQVLDLLGAAFVFVVFSGLIYASFFGPQRPVTSLGAKELLVSIGFQFLIAGMVTAFVIRHVRVHAWLGLSWSSWPWAFVWAPTSLVFMWLVMAAMKVSGYMDWMNTFGVETTQETVKLLQESNDPVVLGLMVFAAVIAAPVCEEVVFRGYLYPVLKKFGGVLPAALSSSLVFAAAHGNLTALLPLFVFGGVLIFLYEKTGSIWTPIAAHFCFNGATVVVQMAARYYEIPISFIR